MLGNTRLEGKQTTRLQIGGCPADDPLEVCTAFVAGNQCAVGLMAADFRDTFGKLFFGKVGGIGDDKIEAGFGGKTFEPVGLKEVDAPAQTVGLGVFPGQEKGISRGIQRGDPGGGSRFGQREGDGSGAGTQIQNFWGIANSGEEELDQILGFRSGNERAPIGFYHQTGPVSVAKNVLERFPPGTTPEQGTDFLQVGLGQRSLKLEVELHAAESEGMANKGFGVETGILHALSSKEGRAFLNDF